MDGGTQRLQHVRRALEGLLGVPATEGNQVDILRNGDEIFPAMLAAIAEATSTVDICTYVYWSGDIAVRFADALSERAQAGVRVRILLDAVGAHSMDSGLTDRMEAAGCQVEWFRPPTTWKVWETNHRTHRKVLICDEDVGFTGGVGIAEEWEGDAREPSEWRDTHVRVRGPAVDGLRACFVSNWAETGRPLFSEVDRFPEQPQNGDAVVQVVQCASQFGWTDMCSTFAALLGLAEDSVKIQSAYFVPDEHFRGLLCEAAGRGVDVQIMVPGTHADKRIVQVAGEADYAPLMDAGVHIYHYERTMLHAKVVIVDGLVATVGSANFDARSMRANEEANIVIFGGEPVAVLERHFATDLADAVMIEPGRWEDRGVGQRAREAVTGLFDDHL